MVEHIALRCRRGVRREDLHDARERVQQLTGEGENLGSAVFESDAQPSPRSPEQQSGKEEEGVMIIMVNGGDIQMEGMDVC